MRLHNVDVSVLVTRGMRPVTAPPGAAPSTGRSTSAARVPRAGGLWTTRRTESDTWRRGTVPSSPTVNVFSIIEGHLASDGTDSQLYGHDENFEPQSTPEFAPTTAPAGSRQKIDILAERIQRGMPLWHPEDSTESAVLVADDE